MVISGLLSAFIWFFVQGIDRMLSWQTLQRPLVTGMLMGLVLGDLKTGIIMGASLEAIFMGVSAIGGAIPSDACAATIIAVSMTILVGTDIETGIALAMPIGTILATVNELWKIFLSSLSEYWERLAYSGDDKQFLRVLILFGLIIDRLPQGIIIFVSIAFGVSGLEQVVSSLPEWVMNGFVAASGMMTAVGFAILLSMIFDKEIAGFFFIGFVLSQYLNLDMIAIAIIMTVVAIAYFINDKKIMHVKEEFSLNLTNDDNEEDFF